MDDRLHDPERGREDDRAQLVDALTALAAGDAAAARTAVASASAGTGLLGPALAAHLAAGSAGSVYDQPAAFAAFIRGGGNVGLYAATSAALAGLVEVHRPGRLLDVGCGDGLALLPALAASSWTPGHLDLLEPSPALLEAAVRGLREAGTTAAVRTWAITLQELLELQEGGADEVGAWDLVQSTFALHTLPAQQRSAALAALRPRTGVLAVVEFDVPDVAHAGPEHLGFLVDSYEQGLAEYGEDRDLVAQGFLMPVLTGQLAPGAVRATWEQPAGAWARQVQDAGFTQVTTTPLVDYWSSPAFLLTARGGAPAS